MTNNELLLSISELIDTKLKPIDDRTKEIYPMFQSIKQIQITLESEIKPRLDAIKSCYLDTYQRYKMGTEEIEGLKADMEVVKNVLSEHSEKIKEFSQPRKSIGG